MTRNEIALMSAVLTSNFPVALIYGWIQQLVLSKMRSGILDVYEAWSEGPIPSLGGFGTPRWPKPRSSLMYIYKIYQKIVLASDL